ncbi:MAG TPA: diaminopropionate ammonia-lyase [Rhizobiaceae bacterium]|nr:diaminopropionate ammonia-lyase [Rhizobiaceae bacterium]
MFLHVTKKGARPRANVLAWFNETGRGKAESVLSELPGYEPTPLFNLPELARSFGIQELHVKDEGQRFGLGSFKALGGAYAVVATVLDRASSSLGRDLRPAEFNSAEVRDVASTLTFACATDGNHGRSVAWGANLTGARCEIFVHSGVSDARVAAMSAFGAHINHVPGQYDDAVGAAAHLARKNGWQVLADTSTDGEETIPLTVMQGYTVMVGEALDALEQPPTHLILQAGVGGMAAAVAAYISQRFIAAEMPKVVVAEPERAACLFASAAVGRLTSVDITSPTVMAMLECATPSPVAWEILDHFADGYVTVEEHAAPDAMRLFAQPKGSDPKLVSGESGAAGLAGLLGCLADPAARRCLKLGADSRVLLINSEHATDQELYWQLVAGTAADLPGSV